MDERHWWLTSKILQTFQISTINNPTVVGDFLTNANTLEVLNKFFQDDGAQILFFYAVKMEFVNSNDRRLEFKLSTLESNDLSEIQNVDIISGIYFVKRRKEEITINNFESEVLCGEVKQSIISSYCDLFQNAICPLLFSKVDWGHATTEDGISYLNEVNRYADMLVEFSNEAEISEEILDIPEEQSIGDFRKNRQLSLNPVVIAQYEDFVSGWIQIIESVLLDSMDESEQTLYQFPQNLLNKWKRRMKTIQGVMDQLKLKQCKTVLAILITAKVKIMKKWRVVDAGLTDAFNDVKDKVKFLDALKKYFEPYKQKISLEHLSSTFLPDLLFTLRHIDSMTRYYARTGFLGTLFAKFSYLIVYLCYEYLQNIKSGSRTKSLWDEMLDEICNGELKTDGVKFKKKMISIGNTGLITSLYTILSILGQYTDIFYTLEDSYGSSNQQQPINVMQSLSKRLKQGGELPPLSGSIDKVTESDYSMGFGSSSINEITFKDASIVLYPITTFSQRIHQLIDIIETMKQFHHLITASKVLPLLVESKVKTRTYNSQGNDDDDSCFEEEPSQYYFSSTDEVNRRFIKNRFSTELQNHFDILANYMNRELSFGTFYDTDKNNDIKFEEIYTYFVKTVKEFESMIEGYVNSVFTMKWKTLKILEILNSFQPIITRTALQSLFEEKYTETLALFENDLETIERIYDKHKENPPMSRNLPAVSSSINWSRTLYTKIEHPMKMLSSVKIVIDLSRYVVVVKNYNNLATLLLCFEENWVLLWQKKTEQNISKLLDLTLLAQNGKDNIVVHANPKMLEVFSDVRALRRLAISIPPGVAAVCNQELKFKFYNDMLEFYVKRYYELYNGTPSHFLSIMKPLHESTLAYFQPALSVLKWDSVNVDGFIHKLHQAIEKFEVTNNKISDIIESKIDYTVQKLKEIVLFTESEICRKVWTVSEFVSHAKEWIIHIGKMLDQHIWSIECALKEIILRVTGKTFNPFEKTCKATSPISISDERKESSSLFSFYASKVYDVLFDCIVRSLEKFHECCTTNNGKSSTHLKFKVRIGFTLPNVVLSPLLLDVQEAVTMVSQDMINITSNIRWWDEKIKQTFQQAVSSSDRIISIKQKIDNSIQKIQNQVDSALLVFDQFDFLWLNNMNILYKKFEEEKPDITAQHEEVQRLLDVEDKIKAIVDEILVEGILLDSSPIKDSMLGFCVAWKMCYVHKLHNIAQTNLKEIVTQRQVFFAHLNGKIKTLDELNHVLREAEHIMDMDNQIDEFYSPVEMLFKKLTNHYEIPLPREELKTVASLRDQWKELMNLAELVTKKLVQEQRSVFEQELDKQVKEFVVAVIQFRNSFDSQGPGLPGIVPAEAALRLKDFQKQYKIFEEKMNTLHAVQKLYGVVPSPFHELEKTGKELDLLGNLYEIYQDFLKFDDKFRDTFWADVNLSESFTQVKKLYEQHTNLLSTMHGWFAFKKLKESINDYREIFPILNKLASKEIRNRHWLQVMHVTKRSFQLEANIFKLHHILDIGLKEHKDSIEQIMMSSKAELELELKLRQIEEEWTEHTMKFEAFKSRGFVVFDKDRMNNLLDSLENSKTNLSSMLTSKYVKPLRDETAAWSLKLNEVSEVLEEWLIVEELWINLEAVFSYENTVKQLPEQWNSFAKADRSYMKLMKKTAESANVLQCCLGGEVSKILTLKQILRELETCFSSLRSYLNDKRTLFPRFHFVSDEILLSMLCKRHSVRSVSPYIREVIMGIDKLGVISGQTSTCITTPTEAPHMEKMGSLMIEIPSKQARNKFPITLNQRDLHSIQSNSDNRSSKRGSDLMNYLSDNDASSKTADISITSIFDLYGEKLVLTNQILLEGQVEEWLKQVLVESKQAIKSQVVDCVGEIEKGIAIEDLVVKYQCQVVLMGFFCYWTRECEKTIQDIRIDRRAFISLNKKFSVLINRLTQILTRGSLKTSNVSVTSVQRLRLQCVIAFGLYALDMINKLTNNKLRDINDYDWQQTLRCYMKPMDNVKREKMMVLEMFEDTFEYRNEFLGCDLRSILTLSSEKVMVNMVMALADHKAGCISGGRLVGKSVLIKSLAVLLGEHCVTVECQSPLNLKSVQHFFLGVVADGSWCMFRDFNSLTGEHLKLMQYCLTTIHKSLQRKVQKMQIGEFAPVDIQSSCGIFLTTSFFYIHEKCPVSLKMCLRNVSISHPDLTTVLKIQLIAHGFKTSKALAYNIKLVVDIAQDQMKLNWNFGVAVLRSVIVRAAEKQHFLGSVERISEDHIPKLSIVSSVTTFSQSGYQQTPKSGYLPSVVSETLKDEFSLIANSLIEIIDARLSHDESLLFKNIVQSVFGSHVGDAISVLFPEEELLGRIVIKVLQEKMCSSHKPFANKVLQLYKLSLMHHGIVICGPSKSGKSTIVCTLIESLRQLVALTSKQSSLSYKQEHMNVLAVSSLGQMFGYMNTSNEWVDGVFTVIMKKANQQLVKHKLSTWITLDGPLSEGWCMYLESLLNESKVFVQPDLKRHYLNNHVKILCETDALTNASPSCITNMGILYVDSSVLGWRPIADAWLASQKPSYLHTLQRAFHKTVDRVLQFIQDEAQCCVTLSECAVFQSCLNMLSSLLNEHTDSLAGDAHVERLYLFSLIWTFGGLLVHENERKQFNELLLSLSNTLPDDDREISVFDYYVDESGEWDTWCSKLSDYHLSESIDVFGEIFLETVPTYRTKFLMSQYLEAGSNVLLIGPSGAGKTSLIQDLMKKLISKNETSKNLTFSYSTNATFLQQFIENNLYHRQGFIYGAKNNKKLKLFIDDVQLPGFDLCNTQSANQLLRQMLDQKAIFSHSKQCKQKLIDGLYVLAAMNANSLLDKDKNELGRLMGMFGVLYLPPPDEKQLFRMTSSLLIANMTHNQGLSLPSHLHTLIVTASAKMICCVSKELYSHSTKPPPHYLFNIGDLTVVFRMLQRCPEETRAHDDGKYLFNFWFHEINRLFKDRIFNSNDIQLFNELFDKHIQTCFENSQIKLEDWIFSTFTTDSHLRMHRSAMMEKLGRKVTNHQNITDISSVQHCINAYVNAFINNTGETMNVVWHDFHKLQLVKLHRILSQECRGNMVIVSSAVEQMTSITQLAAFMLSHHYLEIKCSSKELFMKNLRMAIRTAGCENKQVTISVKACDICDMECLDSLSSIMSFGEYAPLFSDTEMHGLLVALRPKIMKTHFNYIGSPQEFFTRCVRKNLHVVIFTTSTDRFLPDLQRMYPTILSNSHLNYVADDSQVSLREEILVALKESSFASYYDTETQEKVMQILQGIYLKFLRLYRNEDIMNSLDSKDEMNVIRKKILLMVQNKYKSSEEVNILTFKRFLHCFKHIMEKKMSELQTKCKLQSDALSCLIAAEERYENIQLMRHEQETEYEKMVSKVSSLLDELFQKSSLIERLKAKLNVGNSNFCAFMCLINNELMEGEEEFSWEEEHDELDDEYDRMQSCSQEQMKSLDDRITEGEGLLDKQEQEMNIAKELLQSYQVKIDRACIEKLRAYQSPPPLVGTIMVMLMILLGRPEFSHYVIKETRSEKKSDYIVSDGGTKNNYIIGADGRVDRATWKTIQFIMQDSQKFCDFMNNYNWCNGIPNDVLHTVLSFFAPGEEILLSERPPNMRIPSQKDERMNGISLQAARYSSEDAAQVVEYVQLVIQFTHKYKPYNRTMQTLKSLRAEKKEKEKEKEVEDEEEEEEEEKQNVLNEDDENKIEENEKDFVEYLTEEDLYLLQEELVTLEEQFDGCTIKKHKLKEQLQKLNNLSCLTAQVIESFLGLKDEWKEYCTKSSSNNHMLANVIIASTFLSYCATTGVDERKQLMKEVISYCEENGFSPENEAVFKDKSLFAFLFDQFEEKQLEANHVPRVTLCTELASLLKSRECMNAWPLLCDPHHIGAFLVKRIFPEIIVVKYENFGNEIEEALVNGQQLLVTDVDVLTITENKKLKCILESYYMFEKSTPVKLIIEQKELDCSPDFSMILATGMDCQNLPHIMNVRKLYIPMSRDMMCEIFLDFFIIKEKSQLYDVITKVNEEILQQMKLMQKLECELLSLLSHQTCFEDICSIHKILSIKKQFDEAALCKVRAEEVFHSIKTSEQAYTPVAKQASVLFYVDATMKKINPMYQLTIHRFLYYYAAAIKHSDRVAVSVTVDRVLASIFHVLSKAKLEVDRPLFALMVAVETEDIHGRVSIGDREFLINPRLGAAIKQYHAECQNNQILPPKSSIKKPFDWMSDHQYQHLLILSQYYDWFSETFDKMAKDGREMQWRQISEHETPEMLTLPDNLDERYSPLQRFIIIKLFRPDRFMQAAEVFIKMTLGEKFSHDIPLDLKNISHQTPFSIPVLMLYEKDSFLASHLLVKLAVTKEVHLITRTVSGQHSEEENLKATLSKAMMQGWWLLLEDVHHNAALVLKLISCTKKQKADGAFCLWLSADMTCNLNLLQSFHTCSPVIIDSPKLSLHTSLVQNFHLVDSNIWKASIFNEWLPSLHNICMLHASLLQRWNCNSVQQPTPFQFDTLKFFDVLHLLKKFINREVHQQTTGGQNISLKNFPWPSIKQMVNKMVYGREIASSHDLHVLSSIIDYWLSPAATRKDFEVARVRYKLPPAIFSNSPKVVNILQAIDNLPSSTFASTEFCGLFHVPEQAPSTASLYCVNNFKVFVDNLPEGTSILHPDASAAFNKDMDMVLLFSSVSNAYVNTYTMMMQFRKMELLDVTSSILSKLPKLWSKDFVSEKVRRTGELNAFNMWLLFEADAMCLLHCTIKSTLLQVKDFLEQSNELELPDNTISVLLDLYNGTIPTKWIKRAGPSAPPATWNIIAWISDFHSRCSHLEKILIQGREKMSGYWLAAFFNPKRLMSVVIQESVQAHQSILSRGEKLVVKTEMTSRDKDHLRDPPADGIFLYGLSLWGTSWEKATNEIHDSPPKASYYSLPVLHVQLIPASASTATYTCPCYVSRIETGEEILGVDIDQKDVNPLKWPLRGLACTLRPF